MLPRLQFNISVLVKMCRLAYISPELTPQQISISFDDLNYFMGFEVNAVNAVLLLAFYFCLKQTYYDDGEYTKLDFLENPIFWGNWEESNLLLCHLAFYCEPSLSVTHDCRYSEL